MTSQLPRGVRAAGTAAAVVLLVAAGCAAPTDTTETSAAVDLSAATLTVGSKDFTEQHILGEIAVHALQAAGAEVVNRVGLSGSQNVRELLLDGRVDLYWEYTGTAWTNYLDRTERFPTLAEQYQQVAAVDLDEHAVRWLTPAPSNNAYAIATTAQTSRRTGIQTLSGLAGLVGRDPEAVELCVAEEFQVRPDGLPGLQRHYGLDLEPARVHPVAIHDLGRAVARQDPCNFGEVFTTSGALAAFDLTVLDDDQQFFARYHPAVVVRAETARRHPGLVDLFATIAPGLTQDVIIDLNRQVEQEGRPPDEVAAEWVRSVLAEATR